MFRKGCKVWKKCNAFNASTKWRNFFWTKRASDGSSIIERLLEILQWRSGGWPCAIRLWSLAQRLRNDKRTTESGGGRAMPTGLFVVSETLQCRFCIVESTVWIVDCRTFYCFWKKETNYVWLQTLWGSESDSLGFWHTFFLLKIANEKQKVNDLSALFQNENGANEKRGKCKCSMISMQSFRLNRFAFYHHLKQFQPKESFEFKL